MESDPSSFLVSNMLAIATPTLSDYLLFAILILFVFFDFVACGAQIAFFALSQSDIEELSNSERPRDKTIVHLMRNSDRLIASINILDIFSKVFIFTLSFILFQHLLSPEWLNKPIWIVVLSILIVILIDITPKLYAASNPKKFSYRSANFINIIDKISSPLSSLLVNISNRGDRTLHHQRHELSMDELSRALQMTSKEKEYEALGGEAFDLFLDEDYSGACQLYDRVIQKIQELKASGKICTSEQVLEKIDIIFNIASQLNNLPAAQVAKFSARIDQAGKLIRENKNVEGCALYDDIIKDAAALGIKPSK